MSRSKRVQNSLKMSQWQCFIGWEGLFLTRPTHGPGVAMIRRAGNGIRGPYEFVTEVWLMVQTGCEPLVSVKSGIFNCEFLKSSKFSKFWKPPSHKASNHEITNMGSGFPPEANTDCGCQKSNDQLPPSRDTPSLKMIECHSLGMTS